MSLYNLRNPAVKRLMKEAEELLHPTEEYHAQPMEDNLFEWHFTLKGPPNTDYEGGIYHGRITLPPDYPMKPPSIILLTPNGRFETNKKICLSISGHHPESWQPSWSIRTALLAIIGFMPTHGNGAIGSLDYTPDERKMLALKSQEWKCHECGSIKDIFFQKRYNVLKDEASPVSQVITENQEENTLPCSESTDNKSPEISVTEDIHSTHSTREISSLVFRHKSTESASEVEPIQIITTATNVVANNSSSSIFSLIGIWLIVFAIVVLLKHSFNERQNRHDILHDTGIIK